MTGLHFTILRTERGGGVAEIMWPVVRRRAMEEKLSLEEFHDLEEVEDREEDDDFSEEEIEGDIEKGMKGNFHYSPSIIQKRGVSTLHQVIWNNLFHFQVQWNISSIYIDCKRWPSRGA